VFQAQIRSKNLTSNSNPNPQTDCFKDPILFKSKFLSLLLGKCDPAQKFKNRKTAWKLIQVYWCSAFGSQHHNWTSKTSR